MNAITLATYEMVDPRGRVVGSFGASPSGAQAWADQLTDEAMALADGLGRPDLAEDPTRCAFTVRPRFL
jgi:hypothetical protein